MVWLKRRNGSGFLQTLVIGLTISLLATLISCAFWSILFIRLFDGPDFPEDFCTVEDNLFHVLVAHGDEWAEELSTRIYNFSMEAVALTGERLWLFSDERRLGFFVTVVHAFRGTQFGKAGYFYSYAEQLPTFSPEDEFRHLEGKVYCYILAKP